MIRVGRLFSTSKLTLIGDIRDGILACKEKGLVPDAVEINPFYELGEFTGIKIIKNPHMPVGQLFLGKDEPDV